MINKMTIKRTKLQDFSLYIIRHRTVLTVILYISILSGLTLLFFFSSLLFLLVPLYVLSTLYFVICDKFNLNQVDIVSKAFIFLCKLFVHKKSIKNITE
jgi:hypothetical protein